MGNFSAKLGHAGKPRRGTLVGIGERNDRWENGSSGEDKQTARQQYLVLEKSRTENGLELCQIQKITRSISCKSITMWCGLVFNQNLLRLLSYFVVFCLSLREGEWSEWWMSISEFEKKCVQVSISQQFGSSYWKNSKIWKKLFSRRTRRRLSSGSMREVRSHCLRTSRSSVWTKMRSENHTGARSALQTAVHHWNHPMVKVDGNVIWTVYSCYPHRSVALSRFQICIYFMHDCCFISGAFLVLVDLRKAVVSQIPVLVFASGSTTRHFLEFAICYTSSQWICVKFICVRAIISSFFFLDFATKLLAKDFYLMLLNVVWLFKFAHKFLALFQAH